MKQFRNLRNPHLNQWGQVICQVEIKVGDGIGSAWDDVTYVAVPMDVSATGNAIWAALCEGSFAVDEGFEVNFDHRKLVPDLPIDGPDVPSNNY